MSPARQRVMLLLPAVLLLAGAARLNLNWIQQRTPTTAPWGAAAPTMSAMPPGVAFATVFLGGFRGLVADGLWIRAALLQEQGRYFELVQLADWITALEPQFPQVWALQAWNMAYNISVLMPDAGSRWRWVMHGLELLRDRALPATGFDPAVCIEISLLFQHKIGGGADEHADDFKQRWIRQMQAFSTADGTQSPLQRDAMAEALGMNPEVMRQVEDRYGALDWRVPLSHAVYWAFTALRPQPDGDSAVLARRLLYQSMAVLFETGTLTEDRHAGVMVLSPAFALLPGTLDAFEDAMDKDPVAAEGYAVFLARAIRLFMFYRRPTDAEPLFNRLHRHSPSPATAQGFEVFTRQRQTFLPEIITPP